MPRWELSRFVRDVFLNGSPAGVDPSGAAIASIRFRFLNCRALTMMSTLLNAKACGELRDLDSGTRHRLGQIRGKSSYANSEGDGILALRRLRGR